MFVRGKKKYDEECCESIVSFRRLVRLIDVGSAKKTRSSMLRFLD